MTFIRYPTVAVKWSARGLRGPGMLNSIDEEAAKPTKVLYHLERSWIPHYMPPHVLDFRNNLFHVQNMGISLTLYHADNRQTNSSKSSVLRDHWHLFPWDGIFLTGLMMDLKLGQQISVLGNNKL